MNDDIIKYFWENVEKTNTCWNWKGFLDKSGLPVIRTGGRANFQEISPRRLSVTLSGKVLDSTARVQPLVCNNKLCLNPSHLVMGDEGRFWAKVQKLGDNDCWVWTASQDKQMYGKFRICESGKKLDIKAHIYSWELYTGRPVPAGIQVCHKCDHPYCVNPHHLFLGTAQDNMNDMVEKGRSTKGEKNPSAKLNEDQVKEIRELYKNGTSQGQLSKRFGVAQSVVSSIVLGKTWKHIV